MLADLASDLESLLDHSGRVRLLTEVLGVLAGDALLTENGGVASLLTPEPSMPSTDGVSEAGSPVAEVAAYLDAGDLYAGVATPARTALSLYVGHEDWAPGLNDLEDEHGLDAVTRLVGLGLIAEGLSDDDSDGAASAWLNTSSGRASLAWFAAVEVALAFGTQDEPVDADKVLDLLDSFFDPAIEAWGERASERALARARIIVNNWTDVLCPAVTAAAESVAEIGEAVRRSLGDGTDVDVADLDDEARAIGLYRSLVARHVGETIHGETVVTDEPRSEAPPEGQPEAPVTAGDEVGRGDPEPAPLAEVGAVPDRAERLTAITAGLAEARRRHVAVGEELREVVVRREALGAALATIDEQIGLHRSTLKESSETLADQRSSRARVTEESGAAASARASQSAGLAATTAQLIEAETALSLARETQEERATTHASRVAEFSAAARSHRKALTQQLKRVVAVRDAHRVMRGLMAPAEDAPVHAIDDRVAEVKKAQAHAKGRLSELRKGRRTAARQQQSLAVRTDATQDAMATAREAIEVSMVVLKKAKVSLKGATSKLATNESKLRKRRHRVDDLEDRQAGADELVQELTSAIGLTRDELESVLTAVKQCRKAATARQTERKKQIRQRLSALAQVRDESRAALIPLTADVEPQAKRVGEKQRAYDAASEALSGAQARLGVAVEAQYEATEARRKAIELTQAAMGMLRNNAKRLEEAHQTLRTAQAAADGLAKERNLALGKKDRLAAEIVASQRVEADMADLIAQLERAVEQAHSALERNAGKLARAKEKASLARAEQIAALRAEVEGKHARIAALREQIAEAVEDREGLAVAEVRVDTQLVDATVARASMVKQLARLQGVLGTEQEAAAAALRVVDDLKHRLSTLAMDIDGARLSVRGLKAGVTSRRRQVASQQGRLAVLDASIEAAQHVEDDAVERVADFQSWVERTQASIAKLNSPRPVPAPPPVPPQPAPRSAKVDRLLAKLQPQNVPVIPDPSAVPEVDGAATVMVDRESLIQQQVREDARRAHSEGPPEESGEAATEIFTPEDLIARLAEDEGEATVMMPRTQRRPKRTRDD